jgi:AraC-like DNA-binding protein
MRTTSLLASNPEFTVRAVTCREDHKSWSVPEVRADFGVVLARRGRFSLSTRGHVLDVDPTMGYLSVPGPSERFAHPAGGDVCTSVSFSGALWRADVHPAIYVDARLDLAHRRLLRAAGSQDVSFAVAEELLGVLAVAARSPVLPLPGDRAVLVAAREAVLSFDPSSRGLLALAASLGVSPYRLSRVFTRSMGVSLTQYRNRVRVGRAGPAGGGGAQPGGARGRSGLRRSGASHPDRACARWDDATGAAARIFKTAGCRRARLTV